MPYKPDMNITTAEAAKRLGITVRRVQALITAGRLSAEKFGRDYMIREEDLEAVRERRPGRPRKGEKDKKVR